MAHMIETGFGMGGQVAGVGPGQFNPAMNDQRRVNVGVVERKGISDALAVQAKDLGELAACLRALAERLEPVLRPEHTTPSPEKRKNPSDPGGFCQVAQALFQSADQLSELCALVKNLLSRLEV
jgi:hypothetical protein